MSTVTFSDAPRGKRGYDRELVDAFFARARETYEGESTNPLTVADVLEAAFPLERGGYDTEAVDAALQRLATALVSMGRARAAAAGQLDAWQTNLVARAQTLYGRLSRPAGEKFAPGASRRSSYDRDQVDELCERLVDYFDAAVPLPAQVIADAQFRTRRGKRGYDEGSVDAFLRRAYEVLLSAQ